MSFCTCPSCSEGSTYCYRISLMWPRAYWSDQKVLNPTNPQQDIDKEPPEGARVRVIL